VNGPQGQVYWLNADFTLDRSITTDSTGSPWLATGRHALSIRNDHKPTSQLTAFQL
jgi:hypothetical protein